MSGLVRHWMGEAGATWKLAMPIVAGNVAQMLMGTIDTLMVGRLGVVDLAACSFANSPIAFFFLFGIGLVSAGTILGSQALGAGNRSELPEVLRANMAIGLCTGLAIGLLCTILADRLHWFHQPADVTEAARPYFLITSWSLVPTILTVVLKQHSETLGRVWTPMLFTFAGVLANIFLNWVLIYGNLGLPALGLAGAAWATFYARIFALLLLLGWMLADRTLADVRPARWFIRLAWARIRKMLALSFPVAVQLMLEVGAFGFSAILMGWLSKEMLAAHQVALTCAATTFMVPLGISTAVAMRVGQACGAQDYQRARAIGYSAFAMAGLVMLATALALLAGRQEIPLWFFEPEAEAVAKIVEILLIVAGIFQLFDGVQVVAQGCLRGMEDVRIPTLFAFVAYWIVALPLGWFLGFACQWHGLGVWTGLASGLGFAAVALVLRFDKKTREGIATATPRREVWDEELVAGK